MKECETTVVRTNSRKNNVSDFIVLLLVYTATILTSIFVTLKIVDVINWGWWVALSPTILLLGWAVLYLVILIGTFVINTNTVIEKLTYEINRLKIQNNDSIHSS